MRSIMNELNGLALFQGELFNLLGGAPTNTYERTDTHTHAHEHNTCTHMHLHTHTANAHTHTHTHTDARFRVRADADVRHCVVPNPSTVGCSAFFAGFSGMHFSPCPGHTGWASVALVTGRWFSPQAAVRLALRALAGSIYRTGRV